MRQIIELIQQAVKSVSAAKKLHDKLESFYVPNIDFSAVEKKALSEDEREDLGDKKRNLQLAIYWCAKEAIYKRMSRHGVDFAKQMEVEKFNPKDEGEIEATFIDKDGYIHIEE